MRRPLRDLHIYILIAIVSAASFVVMFRLSRKLG